MYVCVCVETFFLFFFLLVLREKKVNFFKIDRSTKRFIFFKEYLFRSYTEFSNPDSHWSTKCNVGLMNQAVITDLNLDPGMYARI